MDKRNGIITFLGPTISLKEAQSIFPNCHFLPPVRCGDVLRALRLRPKVIAIIDGACESTTAVWHKEILYAISQGVTVYGASGIGALRAAELKGYGMLGLGQVYQNYLANHCKLINDIAQKTKNPKYLDQWFDQNNDIELKRQDAQNLLKHLATLDLDSIATTIDKTPFYHSSSFKKLHKNIMCRPFSSFQQWLPINEKVALASRLLGYQYKACKQLAYLISAVDSLADLPVQYRSDLEINPDYLSIDPIINDAEWNITHNCTLIEKNHFLQRITRIYFYVTNCYETFNEFTHHYEQTLLSLMRIHNLYPKYKRLFSKPKDIIAYFKKSDPDDFWILHYIALFWLGIENQLIAKGISCDFSYIQNQMNTFRVNRGLFFEKEAHHWLNINGLNLKSFENLISFFSNFNFIVLENNLEILGIKTEIKNHWWLLDALYLTGIYEKAKHLLVEPIASKEHLQQINKKLAECGDHYAFSLDLFGGKQEIKNLLNQS